MSSLPETQQISFALLLSSMFQGKPMLRLFSNYLQAFPTFCSANHFISYFQVDPKYRHKNRTLTVATPSLSGFLHLFNPSFLTLSHHLRFNVLVCLSAYFPFLSYNFLFFPLLFNHLILNFKSFQMNITELFFMLSTDVSSSLETF